MPTGNWGSASAASWRTRSPPDRDPQVRWGVGGAGRPAQWLAGCGFQPPPALDRGQRDHQLGECERLADAFVHPGAERKVGALRESTRAFGPPALRVEHRGVRELPRIMVQ